MNKYRIIRLFFNDNAIYFDLYNDVTRANFELKYFHYKKIMYYNDIKRSLKECQRNMIDIDIHELIETLETRRKEINEK